MFFNGQTAQASSLFLCKLNHPCSAVMPREPISEEIGAYVQARPTAPKFHGIAKTML